VFCVRQDLFVVESEWAGCAFRVGTSPCWRRLFSPVGIALCWRLIGDWLGWLSLLCLSLGVCDFLWRIRWMCNYPFTCSINKHLIQSFPHGSSVK